MRGKRVIRALQYVASGWILLQAGGCTTNEVLEFLQTVFLGVTAAGAVAIIQNI